MYKRGLGDKIFESINTIFMIIIFILMVYPFIYVLSYSLSDSNRMVGGLIFFPKGLNINSYLTCLKDPAVFNGFIISVLRSVIGPLTMIIITAMAAYTLTKEKLKGIKFLRLFFLFTMYFSGGMIPFYILMKYLSLTGSFAVYIVPGLVNVFNMILIKTYIESLPAELEEAVIIDGGSEFVAFWKVILPLCMPVNAAVILFTVIGHWNSFIDTQIYNSMNPELYTLQYVLYNILAVQSVSSTTVEDVQRMYKAMGVTPQSVKMAITIITIVPIMCVYPFLQKYFASGLLIGSVKG